MIYKQRLHIYTRRYVKKKISSRKDTENRQGHRSNKKRYNYLRIRKGLKTIDGFNHGRRFVTIPSLQDVGKELRLRKRSKELKTVKTAYKERISEFEAEITLLRRKKAALEVQIFG
jgi:hypothetical protein